jgi:NAD-dependent DNA ligase
MIAGLIGSKTARAGLSDIHFAVYEIVGENKMPSPESQLNTLKENGFEVVNHFFTEEIDSNILTNFLVKMKKESPYELDGIIVQTNIEYIRNTDKNPKYAFAFKVQGESANTSVINVDWNVSQWGALKPIVNIKPVRLSGVTISKATGYNGKFIVDNNIGPGAIVTIIRSGDVIPKIINIVKISDSGIPQLPTIPYKWSDTKVDLIVEHDSEDDSDNIQNEMCVKRIGRFFEKLNIKEIGNARVQKLFDNGIDSVIKIISSSEKELIDGLDSEKLGTKIYENIKTGLTNIKQSDLLGATGVFGEGIGQRKLEVLFETIPDILNMESNTKSELKEKVMKTPGYSDISADLIVDNLKYAISFIDTVKPFLTKTTKKKVIDSKIEQTLKDKIYVVSGFRDNGELNAEIEKRGGKLTDTWKANASGVIVGKKAVGQETGKVKKALDKGIKVYTVDEFKAEFF